MTTTSVDYEINGETFEATVATTASGEKPGVMVCHAWAGRSPFEDAYAEKLSALGYTGVAIDLFGKGVLGQSKDENQKLIEPFVNDRGLLQDRLLANLEMVRTRNDVAAGKVAVIGFCFGGLCALDVARAGADVAGVASFHGLLGAPDGGPATIKTKVAAYHGWDDPMATPEDVLKFTKEMTTAKADWQLHAYGGVMHAFTNPAANDPDFGTVFDANADARSWSALTTFLTEIFA